jgi:hypothetical protein
MKTTISAIALAATVTATSTIATAGVANVFDEAALGDFSDDRFAPTFLNFGLGSNIVTNSVVDSAVQDTGDRDYYTFSLAAGQSITTITLVDSSNPAGGFDDVAFVGLAFDSIFDFSPDIFDGPGLEGFILTSPDLSATNVLSELSGGLNFLGEGDYSLWIQQTGSDLTSVTLDFNVVPTPATGAILATMGVFTARRRR